MLDTEALLLNRLVPPYLKPPSWLPMRVDWRHPLARGLRYVHFLDSPIPLLNLLSGNPYPTNAPETRPGRVGSGLGNSYWGRTSGWGTFPIGKGTALWHVTAWSAGSTSNNRYLCHHGANYAGAANDAGFDFGKFGTTMYFGWFNGSDLRATASTSGVWASGDSFTLGGRWDSVNGTQVFAKGTQRGTNATGCGTAPVATKRVWFGGGLSGGNTWGSDSSVNAGAHSVFLWDRDLTDAEFLTLEREPYCFLEPDIAALWFAVSISGDVTIALSGAAITSAAGTLSTSRNVAISGAEIVSAFGALGLERSMILTGAEMIGFGGELGVDHTAALTGADATFSAGSVGFSPEFGLNGEAITVAPGTLTHSREVGLSGAEATATPGEVLPDRELPLTGAEITVLSGVIGGQGEQDVPEARRGEARWRHRKIMP